MVGCLETLKIGFEEMDLAPDAESGEQVVERCGAVLVKAFASGRTEVVALEEEV